MLVLIFAGFQAGVAGAGAWPKPNEVGVATNVRRAATADAAGAFVEDGAVAGLASALDPAPATLPLAKFIRRSTLAVGDSR